MKRLFEGIDLMVCLVVLSACAVKPSPVPASPTPAGPPITPTAITSLLPTPANGRSPLATPTSSELVAPSPTVISPLATPSPLPSLTTTTTSTPSPGPTNSPLPSATALIAVSTPTRLPPTATRPPALPSPTVARAPTATRALYPTTPTQTPAPTVSPILVTAWPSEANPLPDEDVKVYGRLLVNGQPTKGEGMVARWYMKGRIVDCVGDTWVDGVAYCTANTYGLPAGYTVHIEVFIKYNRVPYRATTEVTIRD